jgi:probable F420-dependent oxidoreductase
MRLGVMVRNMGPAATPAVIDACARAAEDAGLADVWVCDHVAIPPEEASGSGGHYLDPLATLAYLAGRTTRIGLGVTVLILPYRPPLPTAKWVASVQALSGDRLHLGVGAGWMPAEFRALGVDRRRRGALTDETLAFLHACFGADEVSANGQTFLFKPRPPRPPILVGGTGEHCLARIVRYGDGWMPMTSDPAKLVAPIADLQSRMQAAGRPPALVVPLGALALEDLEAARAQLSALTTAGATGFVHTARYTTVGEFQSMAGRLAMLASD